MRIVLAFIPVFALMIGMLLIRHNGKREILRFDSVQFFYAFILMPILYVWFKGVVFFLLSHQPAVLPGTVFFWDSVYSLLFLFLYAFTVIHSLTKSFKLKRNTDPLYDLLEHSEYYHLWVSHTILYGGVMVLLLLLSGLNAWVDLPWVLSSSQFFGLLGGALVMAWLIFRIFTTTDIGGGYRFLKLMKLLVAVFLVLHVIIYTAFEPPFSPEKAVYWYQFTVFLGLSVFSYFHHSHPDISFRSKIKLSAQQYWRRFFSGK